MSARAIVHLDESCLGNGREGRSRAARGGLIETRTPSGRSAPRLLHPRAGHHQQPDGAGGRHGVLQLLAGRAPGCAVLIVSDSEYLVKGVREWVPGWKRAAGTGRAARSRTWSSGGRWRQRSRLHDIQLAWVRGHNGHPKNEYANDLAVRAARERRSTDGAVDSGFDEWLAAAQKKGLYRLRPGRRLREARGAGRRARNSLSCSWNEPPPSSRAERGIGSLMSVSIQTHSHAPAPSLAPLGRRRRHPLLDTTGSPSLSCRTDAPARRNQ